ncbi:DUF3224 domain-containing protein [Shewanella sp. GXUN23E]|uniref:DUF3224 domain-containing protein n=1 Tax=Shewanella sp. GXUN23E TaxID=3422498 RepID=UPI003D7E24F8
MPTVSGAFEVSLSPQQDALEAGRYLIEKSYHGELCGLATGQMLSCRFADGSAGYVALETFNGRLEGRSGGFTLLHRGMMSTADSQLSVEIVPGSGSGELQGIEGQLVITNESGKHSYQLNYQLTDLQS